MSETFNRCFQTDCEPKSQEELDADFGRVGGYNKPKRKKTGGRKKGAPNKRTLEKLHKAEKELAAVRAGRPTKLAIDHMDEMIAFFRQLVTTLMPWNADGTTREGRDPRLWFRAVEAFQGFLNLRAPYQSPRLNAVAFLTPESQEPSDITLVEHGLRLERMGLPKPTIEGDYYDENTAGDVNTVPSR